MTAVGGRKVIFAGVLISAIIMIVGTVLIGLQQDNKTGKSPLKMEENLSYHKKESSELDVKQPSPLILKNEMEINANNDKDKDIFVPAPPPEYKEIYAQHIHKHYSTSSQLLNIKVGEVQNLFNSAGISALFIEIDLADKIGKVVPELISDSCTTFDQLPSTEYDGMKVIYDFAPQDKVTTDIGQVIRNIKEGGLLVEFERQFEFF